MSAVLNEVFLHPVLEETRRLAHRTGLAYAGGVLPPQAWALAQSGHATLVDVRSAEERKFVGLVPGSLHVAWATGTALTRNPRFTRELEAKVRKDQPLLLLCRSGKRSVLAAEAAAKAGFALAFNVLEGFEGDLDAGQQRGRADGWRFHGLPWVQD
ncbi:rhodanese-like domain-containing protein [Azohydromonas aeria]|uniref:rhodanese-like domain-containing protein n=1 Tax=Azohydromonas aeria TaxID=2590212 RepID=UPI0012F85216|nr:rhodanese-like domain-containing protein [Azohydromonas aeria]